MPPNVLGNLVDATILVVGGGASGLMAAISGMEALGSQGDVIIIDRGFVSKSGQSSSSTGSWQLVLPSENIELAVWDIARGNDWIADQDIIRLVVSTQYDRMKDFERFGIELPKGPDGEIDRPHYGRGLLHVKNAYTSIGGMNAVLVKMRRHFLAIGGRIMDNIFITDLLKDDSGRISGACGIHARSGEFYTFRVKAVILATNTESFCSFFTRDITGTGTSLAFRIGAELKDGEFAYLRPSSKRYYLEGQIYVVSHGGKWRNRLGEAYLEKYDPVLKDRASESTLCRAMISEHMAGRSPLYMDMSGVPEEHLPWNRPYYTRWMGVSMRKLQKFPKESLLNEEYVPMYMTSRLGVKIDTKCRSNIPGLFAAGPAAAGNQEKFTGGHMAECYALGWMAGKSASEYAQSVPESEVDIDVVQSIRTGLTSKMTQKPDLNPDDIMHSLQKSLFQWDVLLYRHRDRLERALAQVRELEKTAYSKMRAVDYHQLVRLKIVESMLLSAKIVLQAALAREESRLSHIREDFPEKDDTNWLQWIVISKEDESLTLRKVPIPFDRYRFKPNSTPPS